MQKYHVYLHCQWKIDVIDRLKKNNRLHAYQDKSNNICRLLIIDWDSAMPILHYQIHQIPDNNNPWLRKIVKSRKARAHIDNFLRHLLSLPIKLWINVNTKCFGYESHDITGYLLREFKCSSNDRCFMMCQFPTFSSLTQSIMSVQTESKQLEEKKITRSYIIQIGKEIVENCSILLK